MTCRYFAFGGDTNRFCLANAGIRPRSIVRTSLPHARRAWGFGFWLGSEAERGDVAAAAVVDRKLTFDTCGLSEVRDVFARLLRLCSACRGKGG